MKVIFSGLFNCNLRLRLTAMMTFSVSVGLAVVFAIVFMVLHNQSLERRFSELERSTQRIAHEWTGPRSLLAEHQDFPENDFTVSTLGGTVLDSTTKVPQPFVAGRKKIVNRLSVGVSSSEVRVIGVASWVETDAGLRQLSFVLCGLWLPLVVLTAGISWYGGGLVLHPVKELVSSADRLTSGSAKDLLETTDQAEFAALAESLNKLISRVRQAAQVQEQFASDAAHELRSPLALLRTRIETTLLSDRSGEQYQDDLRSLLPKIDRLTSIVETLLASARSTQEHVSSIDLQIGIIEISHQWVLDSGWDPALLKIDLVPCKARIAFEELRIVLGNFLDNAMRHSPDGEPIKVILSQNGKLARLSVRDFGPGLNQEGKEHAFDRFYRSEEDRNRITGGVGIGLAVVKRIVESRKGQIGFAEVDRGAEAVITLPISN